MSTVVASERAHRRRFVSVLRVLDLILTTCLGLAQVIGSLVVLPYSMFLFLAGPVPPIIVWTFLAVGAAISMFAGGQAVRADRWSSGWVAAGLLTAGGGIWLGLLAAEATSV